MKFLKRNYRFILIWSILPAIIMYYISSAFFSSKCESTTMIYSSKPTNVSVPSSMSNADVEFSAVTVDNLMRLINDKEIQKEIGLKLLASHLTLRHADPDIISVKHFNTLQQTVPSEIMDMAGETDSITYRNLLSIADVHPFLVEMIQQSDAPFYSNTAISSISVERIGISDIITISYLSGDPGTGKQTLEIFLDICARNINRLNTNKINKTITYCEQQFQNAKNELQLSGEKLQKPASDVRIRTVQQRQQILDQLNAERKRKMVSRERILNQLIDEQERITVSENSMKTFENQINMPNLTENNKKVIDKLKILSNLYQRSMNDSVSFRTQIDQAQLDLKNELTAIIMPLRGNDDIKKKIITEYNQALITIKQSEVRKAALKDQQKALYHSESLTPKELEAIETCDQKYLNALDELNKIKKFQQTLRTVSPLQIVEKPVSQSITGYKPMEWVSLAGIAGFVFSLILIALKSFSSKKLLTPLRTENKTGLKVAGIIPNDKKIESYHNAKRIKNFLMYYMFWNLFQTDQKQRRILVTSIYPGDGKTFVCEMMSDWLLSKGLKCKIVTPFFEDGLWWVKSHNVVGIRLDPVESLAELDVVIMKLPPLVTGDYPIELIRSFNSTFLVCKSDLEWLSFEKKILNNYISHSKLVPQIILNNVEMDVVKDMLGKINVVRTFHASDKRSSQRTVMHKHKLVSNKEQVQQIVKSLPNLGVILDKNRQIVYANEAITSLLGLGTMDKALGLRPGELVSCIYSDMTEAGCGTSRSCRNCGAVNTILKCINSQQHAVGECRIHSFMDGQLIPFDFKISCSPLEVNNEFFVVTNLADIKGKDEKINKFLNKNVFDVNPSGDVSLLSDLVEKVDEAEQLDTLLDKLKQTGTHFSEEFVEYQRLIEAQNGTLKVQFVFAGAFDVLDGIVRSVRTLEIAKDKKISLAPPFPDVSFVTDIHILEQILHSMLINAVKSVPVGGIVYAGYEKTKHSISFYVFNEGVIPDQMQTEIFQKKLSTSDKGRNLGMYGMKLLGEQYLNGVVGFRSTPESGTRFFITLSL